jgi:hypothetical protein
VAIIGVAGGSLLTAAFGLSQTFAVAVILRCASGALNGNSATVRTMLAEITDSSNAPLAFPILNVAWQIGASIGYAQFDSVSRPQSTHITDRKGLCSAGSRSGQQNAFQACLATRNFSRTIPTFSHVPRLLRFLSSC